MCRKFRHFPNQICQSQYYKIPKYCKISLGRKKTLSHNEYVNKRTHYKKESNYFPNKFYACFFR